MITHRLFLVLTADCGTERSAVFRLSTHHSLITVRVFLYPPTIIHISIFLTAYEIPRAYSAGEDHLENLLATNDTHHSGPALQIPNGPHIPKLQHDVAMGKDELIQKWSFSDKVSYLSFACSGLAGPFSKKCSVWVRTFELPYSA